MHVFLTIETFTRVRGLQNDHTLYLVCPMSTRFTTVKNRFLFLKSGGYHRALQNTRMWHSYSISFYKQNSQTKQQISFEFLRFITKLTKQMVSLQFVM